MVSVSSGVGGFNKGDTAPHWAAPEILDLYNPTGRGRSHGQGVAGRQGSQFCALGQEVTPSLGLSLLICEKRLVTHFLPHHVAMETGPLWNGAVCSVR